ncbi:unnamed protein product [Dracunculus medinensis]|uniref:G_PROTEIN_RECEP_F1_2 domain-containing protein n=1 Tax=Dracunculus medinensis TaxID=318479 RepID=A0A0N4U325_DRAME|nr:unnamed protein product [Dracunculus medinensis]
MIRTNYGTNFQLLLIIFIRSLPNSIYLTVISLLDCLLCIVYILLFGIDASLVFLKNETLFIAYHTYIIPVFIISRITQFAMPYMLILATFERFLWTVGKRTRLSPFLHFLIDFFSKFSIELIMKLINLQVKSFLNCSDFFRTMSVSPTNWAIDNKAYYIFDFHVISFIQTLLPFIILIWLNAFIIYEVLKKSRTSNASNAPIKQQYSSTEVPTRRSVEIQENLLIMQITTQILRQIVYKSQRNNRKQELKNAIHTMIAIVSSYLICNTLHLLLTVLERTGSDVLVDDADPNISSSFYIAFSDTVSFCYMFASAIRIIIYSKCNHTIRNNIKEFLTEFKTFKRFFCIIKSNHRGGIHI